MSRLTPCSYLSPVCGFLHGNKGSLVRARKSILRLVMHRPFKKGYLPGWTEEVFVVSHVRRHLVVTYRLSEWDGTPIKGTFYGPDVQKGQVSDDSLFRVEKVLKRKGRNVFVLWKGWPAKYDNWIPAQPRHKSPIKNGSGGWTRSRPKPADRGPVTRHPR